MNGIKSIMLLCLLLVFLSSCTEETTPRQYDECKNISILYESFEDYSCKQIKIMIDADYYKPYEVKYNVSSCDPVKQHFPLRRYTEIQYQLKEIWTNYYIDNCEG